MATLWPAEKVPGAGGLVALLVVLSGGSACGSSSAPPSVAAPEVTETVAAPSYEVIRDEGRAVEVEVATADPATLRIVFDEVRSSSAQDSAHVAINCTEGGTASVDNRLANGTFARTDEAAVLVGLDGPTETLEVLDGTTCPLGIAEPLPADQAVTADEIVAALTAAGLPVPNPRDNTGSNCGRPPERSPCTNLLTTDLFSVHEWSSPEDAANFLEVSGDAAIGVGPTTTVRFASGGSTPGYDRAAYEAAIVALVP